VLNVKLDSLEQVKRFAGSLLGTKLLWSLCRELYYQSDSEWHIEVHIAPYYLNLRLKPETDNEPFDNPQ
jgi:hypothetical protein